MKKEKDMISLTQVAKLAGVSHNTIKSRLKKKAMPKPDMVTAAGFTYWVGGDESPIMQWVASEKFRSNSRARLEKEGYRITR